MVVASDAAGERAECAKAGRGRAGREAGRRDGGRPTRAANNPIERHETTADEDTFPALPEEVWTYIFGIRAATTIQASFRAAGRGTWPRS
mmetsp:Transcript_22368/g.55131  ORF Transcript_22368/g.55131 Transcript_22368/m.55131 type:complete len:90 (+) Transcript_22368:144-413(+)